MCGRNAKEVAMKKFVKKCEKLFAIDVTALAAYALMHNNCL